MTTQYSQSRTDQIEREKKMLQRSGLIKIELLVNPDMIRDCDRQVLVQALGKQAVELLENVINGA